jgi:hypothetical protein
MGAAIRFSFPSYQISVDNPGRVRDYLQIGSGFIIPYAPCSLRFAIFY